MKKESSPVCTYSYKAHELIIEVERSHTGIPSLKKCIFEPANCPIGERTPLTKCVI